MESKDLWHINGTVAQLAAVINVDFNCCLKGNAREAWDIIIDNQPRTAAQFQVQVKKLMLCKIESYT
jgi:hypothetical protein